MVITFTCRNSFLTRRLCRRNDVPFYFYSLGQNVLDWDPSKADITVEEKLKIEEKWHKRINQYHFKDDDNRPKAYILSMFPYPSGALHMGHVRVYTISDTIARFYRLKGYNVLHPMGWDAFGLPAENAAMERNEEPASWTEKNIEQMKDQLNRLGCNFDWDHEVTTCHPSYYRWTQHIFLLMFKAGLVYRKPALVNWDPVDKTVLADEQIDENGISWRSGAKVEKVLLIQWFIKSTKFAKSLSDGLKTLHKQDWQDIIKLQNAWIGNVNGYLFDWSVSFSGKDIILPVWTDSPEHIDKVTFIAVTLGSIMDVAESGTKLEEHSYNDVHGKPKIMKARRLSAVAFNPITDEQVPVFVVEGLLPFAKGSEAYMGTPSVVSADHTFAATFGIPFAPEKKVTFALGTEARESACSKAQQLGRGGYSSSPCLKDWLISRQRYWGTPIPIIHCDSCGTVPVPEEQLPVVLPPFPKERKNVHSLGSPLLDATDWLHTTCPKCGGSAVRETDTMDTFVDSSWYYLRYGDSKNSNAPFSLEKAKKLMPVDIYIGGKEHAVLHMYFARLMSHFLYDKGLAPCSEPFRRLLVQGMVMGKTYCDKETGQYLKHDEVNTSGKVPCSVQSGEPVIIEWTKMSKSKHNGIDPIQVIDLYGTDTTRLQILSGVSPTTNLNWSLDGFQKTIKLQNSLYHLVSCFVNNRKEAANGLLSKSLLSESFIEGERQAMLARNQHLGFITFNYGVSYQLMVVLTRVQGFIGDLKKIPKEVVAYGPKFEQAVATLLIALAPIAPHFASELWQGCASAPGRTKENLSLIHWDKPVLEQSWPQIDDDFEVPVVVQINSSEVCTAYIPHGKLEIMDKNEVLESVINHTVVKKCLQNEMPKAEHLQKFSGYKAKIVLRARGVKMNPQDLDPNSKTAKKALSKLKRLEKKVKLQQNL